MEKPFDNQDDPDCEELPGTERFVELEELRREIARRILDNQRFLERFHEEDFEDEDAPDEPTVEEEL